MGEYRLGLVGESNYQQAVRAIRPGQPVNLEHEPDNKFDKLAIRAVTTAGTIGYVARDSWLQSVLIEGGQDVFATVLEVTGGGRGQQRGVVLTVWTGKDAEIARRSKATPKAGCVVLAAALMLSAVLPLGRVWAKDAGFARARADNAAYCQSIHAARGCVERQNREMGHFVTMMAAFKIDQAQVSGCMQAAKRGRYIDWTVATPCLRAKVKGRAIGR